MGNELTDSSKDRKLREHLLYLLKEGGAHIDFGTFARDFPVELINEKVGELPYTAWQVLEHMRIAQWDILEFSRNPEHVSPQFPKGYWPSPDTVPTSEMWTRTIQAFKSDLREMSQLIDDPATDLFAPIPHGSGQTILREALLLADHNAYHLGGLLVIAKAVGGKRRRQTQK